MVTHLKSRIDFFNLFIKIGQKSKNEKKIEKISKKVISKMWKKRKKFKFFNAF